ncbi:hypothetical protein SLEP1_g55032 [Rubroshorea leprosula]|uniref:Uncharacterized protein n=1 Tax=Rubroshorea leprosula TaxID=152421 RepID=A0AAV5MHC4_9ROSI|nr:hypothetical protein SLEP1_g55032 [Rubroshorea leprosula]
MEIEGLRVRWTSLGVLESLVVGEEAKVDYGAVLRRLPAAVEEVGEEKEGIDLVLFFCLFCVFYVYFLS